MTIHFECDHVKVIINLFSFVQIKVKAVGLVKGYIDVTCLCVLACCSYIQMASSLQIVL
jgi:hypothetical protein